MRIGIAAYRTLSVVALALLIPLVWFATEGRWMEAALVLAALLALVVTQALLLRCHHCGARPGLWILTFWTALLDYELYFADALFLRQCPRCEKPLSQPQTSGV